MSRSPSPPWVDSTSVATIMVVDDTVDNLRLLLQLLTEQGYAVRPVAEGSLALKAAQLDPPDLILLDIKMPKMNGYEVCKRLKADARTRDVPVIFLTVLDDVADIVKGFEMGGVDYITKPVRSGELIARIEHQVKLRSLQFELMHTSKMAALGSLVAGVAHEINTPVGTAIMSASTLENATHEIVSDFAEGNLKRSSFENYLEVAQECSHLIVSNLRRAGELIQSFKQVAVDQTSSQLRTFALRPYLQEVINNLHPKLKHTPHHIHLVGDETITLQSYPGAIAQTVTNLIINSLLHAYPTAQAGHLCLEISQQAETVILRYSDDGCGIAEPHLAHIFEPFFTTARHRGGSGLGLHLVYNLVTQKLRGTIAVTNMPGQGATFTITLPDRVGAL